MDIIITLTQDEFDRAAVALKTLKRLDDLDENVTDEDIVKALLPHFTPIATDFVGDFMYELQKHYKPEDIFTEETLFKWARENYCEAD